MTDLIKRLRAMARFEHDDLTIGDEAADEIERLRATLVKQSAAHHKEVQEQVERAVRAERERCARMFDIPDGIHGEAEDWCRAAATQIRALKDETP